MNGKLLAAFLVIVSLIFAYYKYSSSDEYWVALNLYSLDKKTTEINSKDLKTKYLSLFCFDLDSKMNIHVRKRCEKLKFDKSLVLECAVQNIYGGDWDPTIISADPNPDALIKMKEQFKCSRLMIDIENMKSEQKDRFNEWLTMLRDLNEQHSIFDQISVAVHAKVSDIGLYDGANANDYSHICEVADDILIMAYDKHIPPYTGPGEIAPIDWVFETIEYTLSKCPREKIRLGLAAYGYDWSTKKLVHENKAEADEKLVFIEDSLRRTEKITKAKKIGIHKFFVWAYGMYD